MAVACLFSEVETEDPENADKQGLNREQIERLHKQQQERVKKLAENLQHKLALYSESEGDEQAAMAFQEQIKIEAEKLKGESYGLELLHSIGGVYSSKAKQSLGIKGGELPGIFQSLKQKKHIMKELWSTVKSAMDMQAVAEMMVKAEEKGMDQAQKLQLEEEASNRVNTKASEIKLRIDSDTILCDRHTKRYGKLQSLRWRRHYDKYVT